MGIPPPWWWEVDDSTLATLLHLLGTRAEENKKANRKRKR